VTGEEKIKPAGARFWVATVEAMPRDLELPFVAIDEIQLAADRDRGHVFTDRLLNMRGRAETLLIGAATMKPLIEQLLPGVSVVSRPRLSTLSFAGEKKITRLPRRSAIVAFSAEEVYAIAELIRRQCGGAAVVLGALSPRTRNAQVALYQSGDVDYLIATDAIGMGLNLDLEHVAFAADRKFDGAMHRRLTPAEFGQIAGRAGRHLRDGTFGTSGRCAPFDPDLVKQLEDHTFDPLQILQWRNPEPDFGSVARLIASLEAVPEERGLTRAVAADDVVALDITARDAEMRGYASNPAAVQRLWEVCQVPDYRKVAPQAHADLVATLYRQLMRDGRLGNDWFARQVAELDRVDGDIDTLSNRIAQVRTWTFVANRPDWLRDPEHWQGVTRQVEDRLSDALHERLAQRFVDRRTSVLMRRLRENAMLEAEITAAGDVLVEGHHVGRLQGFQFAPDPHAGGPDAKALRNAAQKALAGEIDTRAARLSGAGDDAFVLSNDGALRWQGEVVAKLAAGDKLLEPRLRLLADEQLNGGSRELVQARLDLWLKTHVEKLLGPLLKLENPEALNGLARGLGFQIAEALGVLERSRVADDDQVARPGGPLGAPRARRAFRRLPPHRAGPAEARAAWPRLAVVGSQAWRPRGEGLDDILHLAASGRTSIPVDKEVPKGLYRAAGFRVCGERAVRVDILERLADLIRPAIHYRPGTTPGEPPAGTADGESFVVTTSMTSLCGCSGEDFASILRSLGYVVERRQGPPIRTPLLAPAPVTPAVPEPAAEVATDVAADPSVDAAPAAAEASAEAAGASPTDIPAEVAAPEAPTAIEASAEAAADSPSAAEVAVSADAGGEPSAAGAGEPVAADAPVAEVPLIEVWRQHRHQGGRPQRDRRPQQHQQRPGGGGRDQQRDRRPPRGDAAPAAAADGAPAPAAAPQAERPPRRDDRPRGPRPEGGQDRRGEGRGPRPEGQQRRGDRPQHGKDRPGKDHRHDRPGDRPGKERQPDRTWSSERPTRDKAPDPNSPFAKLLALKAELEAKGKG
jgi:ATP-dependent RNA helicase SUPV3L1/SUV3